jgi:hypothetical protein
MPKRRDTNQITAKQVVKVTKTKLPKGEDLLGSPELKRRLTAAKAVN